MLHRRLVVEWWRVAAAATIVVAALSFTDVARPLGNQLYDQAVGLIQSPPGSDIVLVEIDSTSLNQLGGWPWPRRIHAELLDKLTPAKPRAIGYDVLFVEPQADDTRLAAAMRRSGDVFLPTVLDDRSGDLQDGRLQPLSAEVEKATRGVGTAELQLDGDGVVRRTCRALATQQGETPQLFALLSRAQGSGSGDAERCFLIPFAPSDHFLHVSFASLLNGQVAPEALSGKIVLVGPTAPGLGDLYAVPQAAGGLMSGVELQANAAHALLEGLEISEAPSWLVFLSGMALVALLLLGFRYFNPRASLSVLAVTIGAALTIPCALLVGAGLWISPVPAVIGLLAVFMLWGWRRLSAVGAFIGSEAASLRADLPVSEHDLQAGRGDLLNREANQLHALIDQLRRLRAFVAEIVRVQPDALCVLDEHGVVNFGNDAARKLFGQEVEKVRFVQVMASIASGGRREGGLLTMSDGRQLMISEADLSEGRKVVRLADVTALQRAASEREETLQFLSHDLRAPNAGILTLLDKHALEGAPPSPLLDRIRAYARHGLNMADDFVRLARSRARPLDREPLDLSDVAQEAVDMVWAKALARDISIRNDAVECQSLWVIGDRAMLLRAAINLLDNAVKFAPAGATIRYAVEQVDGQICLRVSGPSPEMPPARASNPFAFYAEGRDTDGGASVGLGLAFVESAAKRHGGTVHYNYETGYGATFTICLPAAPQEDLG